MNNTNKTIWFVNKHACPIEYYSTHQRTTFLAKHLKELGYETYIICSSYIHNRYLDLITDNSKFKLSTIDGVNYVFIKGINYKNNELKRILSFIDFSIKVYKLRKILKKPTTIIHTSNLPFDMLVGLTARRLKCKYIIEVLDLWPESFVAFGLIKKNNPLLHFMYRLEYISYCFANNLVFSMEGGIKYIKEKKWDINNNGKIDIHKILNINNGVDLESFDYNKINYKINDPDLTDNTTFKIVYMGSIRLVNDIQKLIDAAIILKDHAKIKFIIYGDGEDREKIKKITNDNNLNNIILKDKWIDPKYVPFILTSCSLQILNYKPSHIFNYGGSQNKLFQSLASGKPICCNVGMNYSLITKYNLGVDRLFNDAKEYSEAIKYFAYMPKEDYDEMCKRVRNLSHIFDYKKLANDYLTIIK